MSMERVSLFAREQKRILKHSFHNDSGYPTEEYKRFLLCNVINISEHDPSLTIKQYHNIRQFFTTWEEDAFGGLMNIHRGEPMYDTYFSLLQAIYGDNHIPDMKADGTLPISNSYIIGHIIPAIIRGCEYHPCKRKNPLHKLLMHEKKEGGKRKKRSTLKRSTRKCKTRRTHKN